MLSRKALSDGKARGRQTRRRTWQVLALHTNPGKFGYTAYNQRGICILPSGWLLADGAEHQPHPPAVLSQPVCGGDAGGSVLPRHARGDGNGRPVVWLVDFACRRRAVQRGAVPGTAQSRGRRPRSCSGSGPAGSGLDGSHRLNDSHLHEWGRACRGRPGRGECRYLAGVSSLPGDPLAQACGRPRDFYGPWSERDDAGEVVAGSAWVRRDGSCGSRRISSHPGRDCEGPPEPGHWLRFSILGRHVLADRPIRPAPRGAVSPSQPSIPIPGPCSRGWADGRDRLAGGPQARRDGN